MHDLIIIGGGPAGVAAGVYAARKRLKTLFIAEAIGGQSTDSVEIQNWIGTEKISGMDLAKALEGHLKAYAADVVTLKLGMRAENVQKIDGGFSVQVGSDTHTAKAVLVATGGSRRKLDVPGAAQFENKGLTYCASCDGPLFAGQDVVVVGAGNAGFESAAQLLAYCKSVTLLNRSSDFSKADAATVEAVQAHANFKAMCDTVPTEVKGEQFVKSVTVKNTKTSETTELPVAGIFVEIGMIAATAFVKDLVALDEWGRVKVDGKSQRASVEGIWSAGDCSDGLYHQNNIAAGDAVKALEDIYYWVKAH
ncbi:MAG TPA: FAD-dependent oxidoreductase [Candidatus Paceibacterota bacterium]|nr:FAD-dependent oxidoreductase [Candidatus Paceibacterota bacterium]